MKWYLKLLIILFMLLFLSACADVGNSEGTNAAVSDKPPRMLIVKTKDDLNKLLTEATVSEKAFRTFKAETADTITYAAIEKKDVSVFSQMVNQVGFPDVTDEITPDVFVLEYQPDRETYDIIYRIDGIRYRFVYTPFINFAQRTNTPVVAEFEIDGSKIQLYQGTNDCLVGEIYANGYQIRVIITDYHNYEDLNFSAFSWSTEMYYIK